MLPSGSSAPPRTVHEATPDAATAEMLAPTEGDVADAINVALGAKKTRAYSLPRRLFYHDRTERG